MLSPRLTAVVLAFAAGSAAMAAFRPLASQDLPVPTEQHKMLQKHAGTYEGTLTMMVPGMPADPIPAKETIEPFGPFWTMSRFECPFMGQPYTGRSAMGYDPAKGKFIGTWKDTMSPNLAVMEGAYDEEKKAIVMHWEAPDMTGEVVPHRSETVFSDTGYVMEFFSGRGEPAKTMEITMERVKGQAAEAGSDK